MDNQLPQYSALLVHIVSGVGFAMTTWIGSLLLGRIGRRTGAKDVPYECGMIPESGAQPRFSVKFYLVAMLFILFDIEIVFLYPWSVIYLLREGLDLPEVSLVCVLDADKEGFLRSRTSLIQTAGRAARHVNGEVVLFADKITGSIRDLLDVTEDRRRRQMEHNRQHGITPHSVKRPVQESLRVILEGEDSESARVQEQPLDIATLIRELEAEMKEASRKLEYERAALLRDQIMELKGGGAVTSSMTNRPKAKEKTGKSKRGWKR